MYFQAQETLEEVIEWKKLNEMTLRIEGFL